MGDKFDADWGANDFGDCAVNGLTELALQPWHLKWVSRGDAEDARAGVVNKADGSAQIRLELRFACLGLEEGQHALPDLMRIVAVRAGWGCGNRGMGRHEHGQGPILGILAALAGWCRFPNRRKMRVRRRPVTQG